MAGAPPLLGRQVLVTRSSGGADELAERLEKLGAKVLTLQALDLVPPETFAPLDAALDRLSEFGWLVFTSQNALEPFFSRLSVRGLGLPDLRHLRVAAIGTSTAKGLAERGRAADLVPSEHVSEALAAALASEVPGLRVLLPRALSAREVLPERLLAAGALEVCPVAVYRAVPAAADPAPARRALSRGAIDAVTFASAGTVRAALALLGPEALPWLARCKVVCIGPITAAACAEAGLVPILAPQATNEGLIAALVGAFASEKGNG